MTICLDDVIGVIIGIFLMDVSKAYGCANHDLIIARLVGYRIGKNSLRLTQNYLSERLKRVKVGSSFSEWLEIVLRIPQGSILEPTIFNVFSMIYFSS